MENITLTSNRIEHLKYVTCYYFLTGSPIGSPVANIYISNDGVQKLSNPTQITITIKKVK